MGEASAGNAAPLVSSLSPRTRLIGSRKQGGLRDADRQREAQEKIQNEMCDLSEGMKDVSRGFLKSIKSDNSRLEKMAEDQDQNLDKTKQELQKGKDLMKSGQLSFCCTIAMLIVSLIIFFMMLPFILFT